MKKIISLILALTMVISLAACSSGGVSQEEYDKVVAERDALQEQSDALLGGDSSNAPEVVDTATGKIGAYDVTFATLSDGSYAANVDLGPGKSISMRDGDEDTVTLLFDGTDRRKEGVILSLIMFGITNGENYPTMIILSSGDERCVLTMEDGETNLYVGELPYDNMTIEDLNLVTVDEISVIAGLMDALFGIDATFFAPFIHQ